MAWRERSLRRLRRAVAVAPARPNWRLGLRAAVATTAPLVLGLRLGGRPSPGPAWNRHFGRHEAAIREALDSAREAILATRLGRPGESARGERLLTCLEGGHRIEGLLGSIADLLESLGDEPESQLAREETAAALTRCASDLRRIADAVLGAGDAVEARAWGAEGLRRQARRLAGARGARYRALATGIERLRDYVSAAGAGDVAEAALRNLSRGGRPLLAPLRDHLDPDSVVFRHALRLALITSAAVGLVRFLDLPAGQWVTIAILGILRPYAGETFLVGLQRVLGVVVGGAVAAVLGASVRDPGGLVALIFLFAVVGVSLLPLNYGYYALFLTPTFVLLAEVNTGTWDLAEARILNTAIGGALALLATRFLLPSPEWRRIPSQLAEALRAARRYAIRVAQGAPRPQLREARRQAGRTASGAEASFQRLLEEGRAGGLEAGQLLSLVTYTRRLDATLTALDSLRLRHPMDLEPIGRICSAVLEDIARSLELGRKPRPLPPWTIRETEDALGNLLERRVRRQLAVLHDAALRLRRVEVGR